MDENGDLLSFSHNILNRRNNYFSQLLNVHNVSDVRQIEVYRAEPLVPRSSHLEVKIAIAKSKKYKYMYKEELPDQWKGLLLYHFTKKSDKTDCNNYHGISLLSTSY
jgi:hypothetical protein